ncbi:MAG: peptidoglycan D,D-transpeptidase FtsI family protein [Nocardioides sp.]
MNKPIRTISIFCLLLFLALMVNATYLQYVASGDLNDNPRNRRIIEAAFSRERGAILVGRDPIAESVPSDDRYDVQRVYPQPLKYAPVTGAFSYFSQTGIERSQNAVLSGDDDRLFVTRLVDLVGNAEPKGGSVQLTIDGAAQTAAYDGLSGLGADVEGAVVALEPATGKILAMVSTPSYDPNQLAAHDLDEVVQASRRLEDDEAEPLINRTIQTTLPPGSTMKLVTAAAVLEDGNYATGDALVPGGDTYQLPLTSDENGLIDNGGRDCGTKKITLTQALANSCNTSFLALADEIGIEKLKAQADAFGFNSDYLEDLPLQAESRFPGDLDRPQTAMSGIGQSEVAATPLQMAMVGAGIANGGIVMRPYIVDEVTSPEVEVLDKTEPSELSKAMEPATAAELTRMMVATVTSGTATSAQIPGLEVAGKTGTAQSTPSRPPYAWFVSFAPAIDPQVAVCVLVQASSTPREDIGGNFLGAPIAKSVMEAVLR